MSQFEVPREPNLILPHEHLFCRFRSVHEDLALEWLASRLEDARKRGVAAIVDVTPYTNRARFAEVVEDSPVEVLGCEGFYLDRYVRRDIRGAPAERLAGILKRRLQRNVSIRPAVLKVATRAAPFSSFEIEALGAVASVAVDMSLPVMTHVVADGLKQLDILTAHGLAASMVALSHPEIALKGPHAQTEHSVAAELAEALGRGASAIFTDLGTPNTEYRRKVLRVFEALLAQGFASRLMVSSDLSWRVRRGVVVCAGGRGQKAESAYTYVPSIVLPILRDRLGLSADDVIALTSGNAARFIPRLRSLVL